MSDNLNGDNSLGEAANRYVTFQIVSSIVGGILFLILVFAVLLPAFNRSNQASSFSGPTAVNAPSPVSGPAGETLTINGRPATPEEKAAFDQQINNSPTPSAPPSVPPSTR